MSTTRPRVAVLGTGTMGRAMARNLLRAGLPVDVWDRTAAVAAQLTEDEAVAHASPADAVARADVAATMLPDAAAAQSVAVGQGMLDALRPGAIWAQMGTLGYRRPSSWPAFSRPGGRTCAGRPRRASCSSWPPGPSRPGPSWSRCSGPSAAAPSGLGDAGAGSRLKLVLNTWLAFLMEGMAESVALAEGGHQVRPDAEAIGRRWHQLVDTGLGGADVSAARHSLGRTAPTS
jgi:3-hydroxyisobutyrate dehydrogenase